MLDQDESPDAACEAVAPARSSEPFGSTDATSHVGRALYVTLPALLERSSSSVAGALRDSNLLGWRRDVAAYAPLSAALIGLLAPLAWPDVRTSFTASLSFVVFAAFIALAERSLGLMLLVGYVAGDLLFVPRTSFRANPLEGIGSHVMADALLALLVFWAPLTAAQLAGSLGGHLTGESVRKQTRAIAFVAAAGMLAYIWCQATIVLVRPVFTWLGSSPPVIAVEQVQTRWQWVVLAAMLGAVAHLALESYSSVRRRYLPPARGTTGTVWRTVPAPMGVAVRALATTFLLAGTYDSPIDGAAVLGVSIVLFAWRERLVPFVRLPWSVVVQRVPAFLRFAMVPLLGYVLASSFLGLRWGSWGQDLRPVLVGAFMTLMLFFVLFPPTAPRIRKEGA